MGRAADELMSPLRKEPHEGAKVKYKQMLRRGLLAGATAVASLSAVSLAAAPAGASNTQMTAVGSFTTFFMMHALFPQLNDINPNPESGALTQTVAQDSQTCAAGITYSTALQPPNGSGQGKTALFNEEGAAITSQGCVDFSRSSSPPAPPHETLSGGQGENGDPANSHLDYYAYALDGVAPLVGSDAPTTIQTAAGGDVGAGAGLTLAQLRQIYRCQITNWHNLTVNSVSGLNDPIVLFWPQSGSGTRAVMQDVLGYDPTTPVAPDVCSAANNTLPIVSFSGNGLVAPNEENAEDGILYQNTVGDANTSPVTPPQASNSTVPMPENSVAAEAIYVYSAGKFTSQWNDTADYATTHSNFVDTTLTGNASNTLGNFMAGTLVMATMQASSGPSNGNGLAYVDFTAQTSGNFDQNTNRGTMAVDANTVSETNEWYHQLPAGSNPTPSGAAVPGVRYVYNVADTVLPGYNGAKMFMGFDNQAGGTKSVLCNGDLSTVIAGQGFLSMTTGTAATPAGSDAAAATCREFQGLSYPGQGSPTHWTTPTFDNRSS